MAVLKKRVGCMPVYPLGRFLFCPFLVVEVEGSTLARSVGCCFCTHVSILRGPITIISFLSPVTPWETCSQSTILIARNCPFPIDILLPGRTLLQWN